MFIGIFTTAGWGGGESNKIFSGLADLADVFAVRLK